MSSRTRRRQASAPLTNGHAQPSGGVSPSGSGSAGGGRKRPRPCTASPSTDEAGPQQSGKRQRRMSAAVPHKKASRQRAALENGNGNDTNAAPSVPAHSGGSGDTSAGDDEEARILEFRRAKLERIRARLIKAGMGKEAAKLTLADVQPPARHASAIRNQRRQPNGAGSKHSGKADGKANGTQPRAKSKGRDVHGAAEQPATSRVASPANGKATGEASHDVDAAPPATTNGHTQQPKKLQAPQGGTTHRQDSALSPRAGAEAVGAQPGVTGGGGVPGNSWIVGLTQFVADDTQRDTGVSRVSDPTDSVGSRRLPQANAAPFVPTRSEQVYNVAAFISTKALAPIPPNRHPPRVAVGILEVVAGEEADWDSVAQPPTVHVPRLDPPSPTEAMLLHEQGIATLQERKHQVLASCVPGDCVMLSKSDTAPVQPCARVERVWRNSFGEHVAQIARFWRPEDTQFGRQWFHGTDEVFLAVSSHPDSGKPVQPVLEHVGSAAVVGKCTVTYRAGHAANGSRARGKARHLYFSHAYCAKTDAYYPLRRANQDEQARVVATQRHRHKLVLRARPGSKPGSAAAAASLATPSQRRNGTVPSPSNARRQTLAVSSPSSMQVAPPTPGRPLQFTGTAVRVRVGKQLHSPLPVRSPSASKPPASDGGGKRSTSKAAVEARHDAPASSPVSPCHGRDDDDPDPSVGVMSEEEVAALQAAAPMPFTEVTAEQRAMLRSGGAPMVSDVDPVAARQLAVAQLRGATDAAVWLPAEMRKERRAGDSLMAPRRRWFQARRSFRVAERYGTNFPASRLLSGGQVLPPVSSPPPVSEPKARMPPTARRLSVGSAGTAATAFSPVLAARQTPLSSCGSDKLVLNPVTKPTPNATPAASTPLQDARADGSQATPTPTRAPKPAPNTSDAGDAWATPTGVRATAGSALRRSTAPLSTPASARAHVLGAASVGMADGAAFARIAHAFVCRPLDPYTPPCHACRHLVAADSKTRMSTCSKAVCCATFCRRCASKLNTKPSRTAGCPKCSGQCTCPACQVEAATRSVANLTRGPRRVAAAAAFVAPSLGVQVLLDDGTSSESSDDSGDEANRGDDCVRCGELGTAMRECVACSRRWHDDACFAGRPLPPPGAATAQPPRYFGCPRDTSPQAASADGGAADGDASGGGGGGPSTTAAEDFVRSLMQAASAEPDSDVESTHSSHEGDNGSKPAPKAASPHAQGKLAAADAPPPAAASGCGGEGAAASAPPELLVGRRVAVSPGLARPPGKVWQRTMDVPKGWRTAMVEAYSVRRGLHQLFFDGDGSGERLWADLSALLPPRHAAATQPLQHRTIVQLVPVDDPTPVSSRKKRYVTLARAEQLLCLCRRPERPGEMVVECDVCKEWYHPPCVGETLALADVPSYKCPMCVFLCPGDDTSGPSPAASAGVDDADVDRRTLRERFGQLPSNANSKDGDGEPHGGWLCSPCEWTLDRHTNRCIQEAHRAVRPPPPFRQSYEWVFEREGWVFRHMRPAFMFARLQHAARKAVASNNLAKPTSVSRSLWEFLLDHADPSRVEARRKATSVAEPSSDGASSSTDSADVPQKLPFMAQLYAHVHASAVEKRSVGKTFTQSLTSRFWKLAPAIFTLPPDVLEAESACMGGTPLRRSMRLMELRRCVRTAVYDRSTKSRRVGRLRGVDGEGEGDSSGGGGASAASTAAAAGSGKSGKASRKGSHAGHASSSPPSRPKSATSTQTRETRTRDRALRATKRALAVSAAIPASFAQVVPQGGQLQTRPEKLRFGKSGIHAWGVFAAEEFKPNEVVVEYIGQIIRDVVADKREALYAKQGVGSDYMFRLERDTILDATRAGSLARYINHSCDPNCFTKTITHNGSKKVAIYAKRHIEVGEELCYDYKFPIEEEKIPCHCGAENCRGTMN